MSKNVIQLGSRLIGESHPVYICGEIGINHNGQIDIAKKLIDYCAVFGFDCAKLQKRDPDLCVPDHQKNIMRSTPWGEMTYLEYKYKMEFSRPQYQDLKLYCDDKKVDFTASVWDLPSLEFMMNFDVPFLKIPSALITNRELLSATASTGKPLVISSGMSTLEEIDSAVEFCLGKTSKLILCHCHSAYPAPLEELNLRVVSSFVARYPECIIGYSGHEFGLDTTTVAAVLGAKFIERHITIDRTMWGTDQMASVEPQGMYKLAKDIRLISRALGDGKKRIYDSEIPFRKKLRGV